MNRDTLVGFFEDLGSKTGEFLVHDDASTRQDSGRVTPSCCGRRTGPSGSLRSGAA
jgi:hypothetical protein